ncbi:MAG: terminase large subunit domain-containing protein [Planctomycetaceae bacterium]
MRTALLREWTLRRARRSPSFFREQLRLAPDSAETFAGLMQPWQRRDFEALDPAWLRLAGVASGGRQPPETQPAHAGRSPSFRRAYIERPRGHAKTSDMAVQIAWILLYARHRVEGLAAAADRDQAALVWDAVARLAALNPELCAPLEFRRHQITRRGTGSKLDVISSDVSSSFGALPDFVICDELCHWEKPEMWHSLCSSAAKKPKCLLIVLTNAGVGRGWQWELREAARTSPHWHFSSLNGAQAPWITPDVLDEQKALLPEPVYLRLWQNQWQHSDGEFVTLAEAEACRDDSLTKQHRGQPHRRYVAAVDYAEKHDFTVGVVAHREGERIVVDAMDLAVPRPNEPVMVRWVEDWIRSVAERFGRVTFVLDEWQLLGTIQALEHTFDVRRFSFSAGRGNHALAVNLRRLILHRNAAWYPDCGRIDGADRRDDLETELSSLLLKQSATGWVRIDHRSGCHDDRSFALGAACLHLVENAHDADWLHVTPPRRDGTFAW